MRFEAHWNFSEISVEFSASLETSGIAVDRNSTDFFSRVLIDGLKLEKWNFKRSWF